MTSAHRLPIQHPEYRYPESWNPYSKRLLEYGDRIYSDNQTETHRGSWLSRFRDASRISKRRELHVEIGCNAGHVILEWAARNPEHAFIGIDWKFKPIFRGAEKAAKRGLDNLIFFRAHAERLPYMFGPGEIDALSLYFPDPWPRKKQWKNRFLTADTLRALAPTLRTGGVFHIKTDHAGYFEWMEAAIAETTDLWEPFDRTTDLHGAHPAPLELEIPEVTLFERLFIRDGIRINSVRLRRR